MPRSPLPAAATGRRLAATAGLFVTLSLNTGCAMNARDSAQTYFSEQVGKLLADRDSAEVPASSLTDFRWDKLCFERDDALLLKFSTEAGEKVFRLDYEQYFVAEPYVEKSLADRCVGYGERIVVKKKYPGYEGPVEFQQAG